MDTIVLDGGTSVQLESRTCTRGCGLKFKCLPSSEQRVAKKYCDTVCGKKPVPAKHLKQLMFINNAANHIPPRATENEKREGWQGKEKEMRTTSENAELVKDKFKTNKSVTIGIEGDYFFVGTSQDSVLFLGGDRSLPLLKKFMSTRNNILTKEQVIKELKLKGSATSDTVNMWLSRIRSMLKRNFGGEWFIPVTKGWRLCPKENILIVLKDRYASVTKEKVPVYIEKKVSKPKPEVKEKIGASRSLTLEEREVLVERLLSGERVPEIRKDYSFTRRHLLRIRKEESESRNLSIPVKGRLKTNNDKGKLSSTTTTINISNSVISVGKHKAVFSNRPVMCKLIEAFAQAEDYTLSYKEIFKAIYGKADPNKDHRRCHGVIVRLKEALKNQIPSVDWIVKRDDIGSNNIVFWRIASGNLDIKLYYSREFIKKQNQTIERQKTQQNTSALVIPIDSARTVNVTKKDIVTMSTSAKKYEDAVEEVRKHLGSMQKHRICIARLAFDACDIKRGGGGHWTDHSGTYTLKKFAADSGMAYKTLDAWVSAYRLVVVNIQDKYVDEADWTTVRRTYQRVKNETGIGKEDVRTIYDEERNRNGGSLDLGKMVKYTRYHTKKIIEIGASEVEEEELVQLLELVSRMKERVSDKLKVKRRDIQRAKKEGFAEASNA